jgi:hypothetical protein
MTKSRAIIGRMGQGCTKKEGEKAAEEMARRYRSWRLGWVLGERRGLR